MRMRPNNINNNNQIISKKIIRTSSNCFNNSKLTQTTSEKRIKYKHNKNSSNSYTSLGISSKKEMVLMFSKMVCLKLIRGFLEGQGQALKHI